MTGQREGGEAVAVDPRGQVASCAAAQNPNAGGVGSAGSEAAGPGLVYSSTSHTLNPDEQLVDRKKTRLNRLKRSVITSARLHQDQGKRGGFRLKVAMVTLTYRDDASWHPRQIAAFTVHVRNWLKRRGHAARYVWCMEYTKRGRPHYHFLIWLPKGLTLPKPDKQGWWRQGMTRIEWARNAVGYIAKYATKGPGKSIEKGARLHGCGGLDRDGRIEKRWWLAPKWVREWTDGVIREVKRVKGGWLDTETGEVKESEWVLVRLTPFGPVMKRRTMEGVSITC